MKIRKWRRRYQYLCAGCGKIRFTLRYKRQIGEKCTLCAKTDKNSPQASLFDSTWPDRYHLTDLRQEDQEKGDKSVDKTQNIG